MTKNDVQNIFNVNNKIHINENCSISVEKFLEIGFKNAPDNPSKQDLLDIDGGKMGYADLIEKGNYS